MAKDLTDMLRNVGIGLAIAGSLTIAGAAGLGYLGYGGFREPVLKSEIEKMTEYNGSKKRVNYDGVEKLLIKDIYKNPRGAKKFIFSEFEGARERFDSYNFGGMKIQEIEDIEKLYKENGFGIRFPKDPKKFSESDKLAIFYVDEVNRNVADALSPLMFSNPTYSK